MGVGASFETDSFEPWRCVLVSACACVAMTRRLPASSVCCPLSLSLPCPPPPLCVLAVEVALKKIQTTSVLTTKQQVRGAGCQSRDDESHAHFVWHAGACDSASSSHGRLGCVCVQDQLRQDKLETLKQESRLLKMEKALISLLNEVRR